MFKELKTNKSQFKILAAQVVSLVTNNSTDINHIVKGAKDTINAKRGEYQWWHSTLITGFNKPKQLPVRYASPTKTKELIIMMSKVSCITRSKTLPSSYTHMDATTWHDNRPINSGW